LLVFPPKKRREPKEAKNRLPILFVNKEAVGVDDELSVLFLVEDSPPSTNSKTTPPSLILPEISLFFG